MYEIFLLVDLILQIWTFLSTSTSYRKAENCSFNLNSFSFDTRESMKRWIMAEVGQPSPYLDLDQSFSKRAISWIYWLSQFLRSAVIGLNRRPVTGKPSYFRVKKPPGRNYSSMPRILQDSNLQILHGEFAHFSHCTTV